MNDNGQSPFDEFMRLGDIIVKISDCSVWGCYRNGVEVLKKDMTDEELSKAHVAVRQRMFDIVAYKTKDFR